MLLSLSIIRASIKELLGWFNLNVYVTKEVKTQGLQRALTHACFGVGWSGATAVDDLGKNCCITPVALPLPFEIDERLNATGVVGIWRGYCLIGTFEPLLSVDNISSRSI